MTPVGFEFRPQNKPAQLEIRGFQSYSPHEAPAAAAAAAAAAVAAAMAALAPVAAHV